MSSIYNPSAVAPPTGYTIPSDGDAKAASSVNVPFQALMDNVKYLYTGRLTPKTFGFVGSDSAPATAATYSSTSFTAGPSFTSLNVAINDIVVFMAFGQSFISTGPDTGYMRLTYRYNAGSYTQLLGAMATISDATDYQQFTFVGALQVTTAGTLDFRLEGKITTGGKVMSQKDAYGLWGMLFTSVWP